jgi:hypothetical protein
LVSGRAGPLKAVGAAVNAPCGGDNEFAPPVAVEDAPVCLGGQAVAGVGAQVGASTQEPLVRVKPRASSADHVRGRPPGASRAILVPR